MTITAVPVIKNGNLMVRGKVVLTNVPNSVVVSPANSGSAFIGACSSSSSSHHVFNLGVLENCKFMCLFIAKIWWMIPRVGKSASEIPLETQMLLLQVEQESALDLIDEEDTSPEGAATGNKFYVLVLPVLDGPFRTTLLGTKSNELQFCMKVVILMSKLVKHWMEFLSILGTTPLNSSKIQSKYLPNTRTPAHLDWFGWCTWDAFYTEVSPSGIKEGLQSFKEGGVSPKFLIIDDGWQETENEFHKEGEPRIEGTQFATRLTDIKENSKFKDSDTNLKDLIHHIKENYGLKYVYMWHALAGYWGGVQSSSETLKKYNPKLQYPVQSPGKLGNIRDIAMDSLEKYGVGMIDPQKIYDFYNDMHGYLASSGVDGVKVDVQNLIETLGAGHGGRVSIAKQYHQALDESIENNFRDNNLICCMSHNSDMVFSSMKSATARASEDFMPNEPTFQTLHIAAVSFNSLLLGEVVVPDWDMFHSNHSTAHFHGAARAIGGCPIYVSDKPGKHDFEILRKLVLPDGSILRARYAGRPTRDSLFTDPVMDGKSLLKIWNLNKLTGVVGVFNCQGSGTWPMKQARDSTHNSASISGRVSPLDVEYLEEIAGGMWTEDCAVYAFNTGSLSRLRKNKGVNVSLGVLECEIFTVSPIKMFNENIQFAPIGLINMYNSGGAVEDCSFDDTITVKVRGAGLFGAYSSKRPSVCKVDKKEEDFTYSSENGLLTVNLQTVSDNEACQQSEATMRCYRPLLPYTA
ncbi:hypothetical protein ACS0TY_035762 [Phlomoides rotata]